MNFDFATEADKQTFMNLKGLVNKNGGFFKSSKQAKFLFDRYSREFKECHDCESFKRFFGVELEPGQIAVTIKIYTRWADYGSRSVVPVLFVFAFDKFGVVKHFKVGGRGNLRDGWAPDSAKCKLLWERSLDSVAPFTFPTAEEIKQQEAAKPVSSWIGNVGDKVTLLLKITSFRSFGYNRFGESCLSTLIDASGNIFTVWKQIGDIGTELIVKGTIKENAEFRSVKQTVLTRVKVNS